MSLDTIQFPLDLTICSVKPVEPSIPAESLYCMRTQSGDLILDYAKFK